MKHLLLLIGFALPILQLNAVPPAPSATTTASFVQFHVDSERGDDRRDGRSPRQAFRTLERARDAARGLERPWKGDVEILLHSGTHRLDTPLLLTELDSGKDGHVLRFAAARGAKPVLDGGTEITGWRVHDPDRGIWTAPFDGRLMTRQLFVNGRRAVRARSVIGPEGIVRTNDGYTLPINTPLAAWRAPQEVEFVYRHIWTNPRVGVENVERAGDLLVVTMEQPGFENGRNKGITSIDLPWYLENAYELLDQPGEWFFDRTGAVTGKPAFYYAPYEWENLKSARVTVPRLEQLVDLRGASFEQPVRDIEFVGIGFEHTTWLRPSSNYGLPDAQNNVMRENFTPDRKRLPVGREFIAEGAALRARQARSITIHGCTFQRLGGIGVAFGAGAQDVRLIGNSFRDVSGTGIQLGDYLGWTDPLSENHVFPSDPRHLIDRNQIIGNFLDTCGVEFRSSTAIALSFPRNTLIARNEVRNMPYSGMHLGWGWNRFKATATGANVIEHNLIRNVMIELADGGSIYTLGASDPGVEPTILRHNHALGTRWGQGFYFDESSSRYRATDNRIERISDANIKINGAENNDIEVRGLYSDKTRNLVTKSLEAAYHKLSIEDVRPLTETPHRGVAGRIQAEAGIPAEFGAARVFPGDPFLIELEQGDLAGAALVTTGMDRKPFVHGYSGMAYVDNLASAPGAAVSVSFELSVGGRHVLRLRYSAESEVSGLALILNGKPVDLGVLPSTGGRSNWSIASVQVRLNAGLNTLVLRCKSPSEHSFQADRIERVPAALVRKQGKSLSN